MYKNIACLLFYNAKVEIGMDGVPIIQSINCVQSLNCGVFMDTNFTWEMKGEEIYKKMWVCENPIELYTLQ